MFLLRRNFRLSDKQNRKFGVFIDKYVNQFYSENLLLFLKNDAKNLLELAFGDNWQISNLVDAYDKLTLYSKSFTKKPWPSMRFDLKLNNWIREGYFSELSHRDFINKSDLERSIKKMNSDLKKLI